MKLDYTFLDELNKPNFQPPEWIFNYVWPTLYILMFISLYVFLSKDTTQSRMVGVWAFLIQLGLNFAWTPAFFALKNIPLAFFISVFLTIAVTYMIFEFWKISPLSAILNIPYLLWVIFADILNFYLWKLNQF